MKIKKYTSIVLLVVCSLVLFGCNKKSDVPLTDSQPELVADDDGSFSGSLKNLLGMGKKVECSWQTEEMETGASTVGKVFVDGNRSKSEVTIKNNEGEMVMMSLLDGKTGYMWDEKGKIGSKYDIAEMEKIGREMNQEDKAKDDKDQETKVPADWEDEFDYVCKPWRVDESVFTVPSDIEFTDMVEQMKQAQEFMGEMQEGLAGICDSLPEPQKSQCLESMEE